MLYIWFVFYHFFTFVQKCLMDDSITTETDNVQDDSAIIEVQDHYITVEVNDEENNIKKNKIGGRPKNKVWEQFIASPKGSNGHFSATCKWCDSKWARGDRARMESHLANHCTKASALIVREYLQRLSTEDLETTKKRKITDQPSIKSFHDSIEELPEGRVSRINRALAKAFICAGLPFQTIENPFFVDFLKELNPAYHPPSRDLLSNRLIEEELAKVNYKLEQELRYATNLTLGKKIMFTIIIY